MLPDGRVLVADAGNNRLQVFSADGDAIGSIGVGGSGPGEFDDPQNVAVAPDGRIYVADTGNRRIQVLSSDFKPIGVLKSWPYGENVLARPRGLAIAADGTRFVSDLLHTWILRFQPAGPSVGAG